MATSSKVKFKLAVLSEKALESMDFRIAQAQLEVDSFEDDEALAERIKDWRARQESKISEVFAQLGEGGVDDYRLSKFKLDPIPDVDTWDRRRAEDRLRQLKSKRTQTVAKSESLVPDEEGNISLTKTQLGEFFDL